MFYTTAIEIHFDKDYVLLGDIFNDLYGICTAYAAGLFLLSERRRDLVPIVSLFFVIGTIFVFNKLFDGFYKTYYPILIIIVTCLISSILYVLYRHKFRQRI